MFLIDKYILLENFNSGSFSNIFKALHKSSNSIFILKVEDKNVNNYLFKEFLIYKKLLCDPLSSSFIPYIHEFINCDNFNLLVMDDCGVSLDTLISKSPLVNHYHDFSFNYLDHFIINSIKPSIFKCLEFIHSYNIIHRDIKPANFILHNNSVKLIDFGLSYILNNDIINHPFINKNTNFVGTLRYCSKNAIQKFNLFFIDDCESAIYTLIFCYQGFLPWQSSLGYLKSDKLSTSISKLCSDLPPYFSKSLFYLHSLPVNSKPNYSLLF